MAAISADSSDGLRRKQIVAAKDGTFSILIKGKGNPEEFRFTLCYSKIKLVKDADFELPLLNRAW